LTFEFEIPLELPPNTTIGNKIKRFRLFKGLKQVDLGKILGVDEMTIVNWEKERTKPQGANVRRIQDLIQSQDTTNCLKQQSEIAEGQSILKYFQNI